MTEKEWLMSSNAARNTIRKMPFIPDLVRHARQVHQEALRMVNTPAGGVDRVKTEFFAQDVEGVVGELVVTIGVLRQVSGRSGPASERTEEVGSHTTAALELGSAESMIRLGQLLHPVDFQQRMGWSSRQAVWKAVQSQRVFYLLHQAERYFPAFYADPRYERKHLEAVTKVLGNLPGGSKLQFFLTRKASLGGQTPLQALATGRVAKVKDIAAAFAEAPTPA
jgi:hypothetical protein